MKWDIGFGLRALAKGIVVRLDAAVSDAIDRAAGYLSDAGYVVEPASPPQAAEIAEAWHVLIATEVQGRSGKVRRQVQGRSQALSPPPEPGAQATARSEECGCG